MPHTPWAEVGGGVPHDQDGAGAGPAGLPPVPAGGEAGPDQGGPGDPAGVPGPGPGDVTWQEMPPEDPALLKHIGGDLYAVVAVWNLTELERAVLSGRGRAP